MRLPYGVPLRPQARLLDYVTVAPGYVHVDDAGEGPLVPGKYGIVLLDDTTDNRPLKVGRGRALACVLHGRTCLQVLPLR